MGIIHSLRERINRTSAAIVLAAALMFSGAVFVANAMSGASADDRGELSISSILYLSPAAVKDPLTLAAVRNMSDHATFVPALAASDPLSDPAPEIGVFVLGSHYEMDEKDIVYGARASLGVVNMPENLNGKIPSFKISRDSQSVASLSAAKHDDGTVSYTLSFIGAGDVDIEMEFVEPEQAYIPGEDITSEYIFDQEAGVLRDPVTGYAYDESTGYLIDDDGNSYDPVSLWKVDPETGYLIDPDTGLPVIPDESGTVYTKTIHVGKYMLTVMPAVSEKIYDGTQHASAIVVLDPLAGDEDSVRCVLSNGMFDTPDVGEGKHVEFSAELTGVKASVYDIPSSTVTSDDGVIVPAHVDWMRVNLPDQSAANNGTPYADVLLNQPEMTILNGPDGADVGTAPDSVYLEWYVDPECTQKVDMTKRFEGAQGSVQTFYYKVCVPQELSHNFTGEKVSSFSVVMLDNIVQNLSFELPRSFVYGDEYQLAVDGAASNAQISFYSLNSNAEISDTGLMKVTGVGDIDIMMSSTIPDGGTLEIESTSTSSPKQLSILAQVLPKMFDGSDKAEATAQVEGIVPGDTEGDISFSLVNGRFIDANPSNAGNEKQALFDIEASGAKATCYDFPTEIVGTGDVAKRSLQDITVNIDEKIMVSGGDSFGVLPTMITGTYAGRSYTMNITWYKDEALTQMPSDSDQFEGPKGTEFDIYYKLSPTDNTAVNFEGNVTGCSVAVISDGDQVQPDFSIFIQNTPVYGDNLELGYKGGAEGAKVSFSILSQNAHLLASGKTAHIDDLGTLVVYATCTADGYATKTDTISLEISKRKAMITVFARDKRYDGTNSAFCNPAIGHVLSGDDVSFTVSGVFDDASIGTDKKATFIVTATGDKKDYYDYPTVLTSKADILPIRGVAIDAGFTDMVVSNNSKADWLPETFSFNIPEYKTITGNVKWYTDKAHTNQITKDYVFSGSIHDVKKIYYNIAFGADAAGYVDKNPQGSIDVIINTAPRPADITVNVPSVTTYGDTIELSSNGNAGKLDNVTYSIRSGSGHIENGNTLVVTGITPIILEATSAADGYQDSKGVAIITINKKHLNVTAVCDAKKYDGGNMATGIVEASGFAFSDADEIRFAAANGRFSDSSVGEKEVTFDVVTVSPKAGFYEYSLSVTTTGTIR